MEGKVKWFNPQKGYGFIEGEDGQDYFLHRSALPGDMEVMEGESVTFDGVEGDRGLQARNVKRA